jgi:hypothetical protein
VPRGQAVYVLGLIVLLAFAAVEFLFFIGLVSRSSSDTDHLEADEQQEKPGKDDAEGESDSK